jgi:hypothetical protein
MVAASESRKVPGTKLDSQVLRSSTAFLENAIWMASPSVSPAGGSGLCAQDLLPSEASAKF